MTSLGITGATRILGLIADPVAQARSPAMANALLARRGKLGDFVLVPMQVAAGGLEGVIAGLRRIGSFAGAIVSMPHKSAVVPLLDDLSDEARLVGAANVMRRCASGRLSGTALDGEGFVTGLRSRGHEVTGAACLLTGAGGAAASIAFALARYGCRSLTITNRTISRAAALAERVRQAFPKVDVYAGDDGLRAFDVAINATSLGMKPGDEIPMSKATIDRSSLVAECVISPETTRLLETAASRGRAVHSGVPMLESQMELMLRYMGVL